MQHILNWFVVAMACLLIVQNAISMRTERRKNREGTGRGPRPYVWFLPLGLAMLCGDLPRAVGAPLALTALGGVLSAVLAFTALILAIREKQHARAQSRPVRLR